MFAALSENGQAHIAAACEFSIFPARPCCRRNKEKERKQSNAQKKLWKRSAEGIILESVLEGYAEYYSAELSEKVIRGMTENALKKQYNGGNVPTGYYID